MKPHLWFVRAASRLVSRRWRKEWQREWEAELHHHESLGRHGLFRRSLGSFWDALSMQPRRLEDELFQDLRYGIRMLLNNATLTAVAILSLAVGIGANTAVFSVANAVMLKQLPAKNAEELLVFEWFATGGREMVASHSGGGYEDASGRVIRSSFPNVVFDRFRNHTRTLSGLAAYQGIETMNVSVKGDAEVASGLIASGSYYRVLGVDALIGRTLADDDDRPEASPVAVLDFRYWERRFGLDPRVVGQTIVINTVPFTVVGVTPKAFVGTETFETPDIYIPLGVHRLINVWPDHQSWLWWLRMIGRRNPGVTVQQVHDDLQQVFGESVLDSWNARPARLQAPSSTPLVVPDFRAVDGSRGNGGNPAAARLFSILMAIVGLVLLIVCANVANLLVAKGAARRNEMAIRGALGANRARLVRQLLVESVLLASSGAALGITCAYWGQHFLTWAAPSGASMPPTELVLHVLAFTAAITLFAGIVFGLAPGLRSTRIDPNSAMKNNSRSVAQSRTLLTKALLVTQVAASLILLVGAGLLTRSLANVRSVDFGFNTKNLVVFKVDPVPNRYTPAQIPHLYDRMIERLAAIPGVLSATLSENLLLSGSSTNANLLRPGRDAPPSGHNSVQTQAIRFNFFDTMQMALLRGRHFTPADRDNTPLAAIINETLARRFFDKEDPLGQQILLDGRRTRPIEVVGVVRDSKYRSPRDQDLPTLFVPYLQQSISGMGFEVRTAADPSPMIPVIREAMRQIDANLPLIDIKTQEQQTGESMFGERLFATFSGIFGAVALLLSSMGLYALMSYMVARRTNEIGIRMALGAQRFGILRLVMRETALLVSMGTGIGVLGAVAVTQILTSLLYGLAPHDPLTILLAATTLVFSAAIASYLPARRATGLDPMLALREE